VSRSQVDALEDENVALVWSVASPGLLSLADPLAVRSRKQAEDTARDIIRRAVALGRSLERHPSNITPESE
jgi:hypothetical protein